MLALIRRYRTVLATTGGRVILSGGEPLLQAAFVARLFAECRALGVHTALDTLKYLRRHTTDALLTDTDLVLLDVKSGLPETYREVASRRIDPTIELSDRLAALEVRTWVRFVLVPELTDAPDDVDAVAELVTRWSNVERVEVLPFHEIGESRWERLGRR